MHLRSGASNASGSTVYWAPGVQQPLKANARYFGLNLVSELDTAGEYYISRSSGLLYYLPAVPLANWDDTTGIPVLSVNQSAIFLQSDTSNVTLSNMVVQHATSIGISGQFFRLSILITIATPLPAQCFRLLL